MSGPVATYSFLPWLRQGIANQITTPDNGAAGPVTRASVHVKLEITGEPLTGTVGLLDSVERDVQLYSPGDVVGIDPRAIIRTEPRNWITNYEPNYLPAIEFYDEDFPWRYTPSAPDATGLRLRPWIALVVLEEEVEFSEGRNLAGKPLPYIDVLDSSKLPNPAELWAWAHVHVNRSLAGSDAEFASSDMAAVLPRFAAALQENRDLAYSRIVCPRRLQPNSAYHAFLVPVFESGRLAGLGKTTPAPGPTTSAWGAAGGVQLPIYYRWYFHTGDVGDFEYLVRLLKPQEVDHRVGIRDVDVRTPGALLPGIDGDIHGVLKLGGALRVPRSSIKGTELADLLVYENWADVHPPPHPFQAALARFINLADDYQAAAAAATNAASDLGPAVETDADPLITAPLYARWHALVQRLLVERDGAPVSPDDNWIHELNLDPRHRTAAGFGTRVVQTEQERYMDAAWSQIGDVLDANRRIRQAQLGIATSARWYDHLLAPLSADQPGRLLTLTAPMQRHIVAGGATIHHARSQTLVPPALTSAAMRRITRPRGRLMRALPFDATHRPADLLDRVASCEVDVAPPKVTPPGIPTTDGVAEQIVPTGLPPVIAGLLRRFPWLWLLVALLALILGCVVLVLAVAGAPASILIPLATLVVALVLLALWLRHWSAILAKADAIREDHLTGTAVDQLPKSPDFVVSEPGSGATPHPGAADSDQAARFKRGLREWHELHRASAESSARPKRDCFGLGPLAVATFDAIDPKVTIPKRTISTVRIPPRIQADLVEEFGEVIVYPVIDEPMYQPLKNISDELFLPNVNLIALNSITILETNQKFIESYMVGLNHEFSRELLWREYPTDQRGSTFRQFWDARSALDTEGLSAEDLKEKLRDIPKLHRWPRRSALGQHDHREKPGDNEEELVLAIRGELLKKYPNAVIYAHHAAWQMTNGKIDPANERTLEQLTPAEELKPPPSKLLTPLYEARVDPDITFFGFDLTVSRARGASGEHPNDEAGWFFVIKERPGEPRFGFDIESSQPIQTVNDVGWDVVGGAGFAPANALQPLNLATLGAADIEKTSQRDDDVKFLETAGVSSARWAYILYQAPVMVAVHAAEMLPEPDEDDA